MKRTGSASLMILFAMAFTVFADSGNRLAYLDAPCDPYYVGLDFPKLATPQWVGEPGVEAVVVLAIDDMSGTERYETFLRPLLERLKEIDGRAPVSIMTKEVDRKDPLLEEWLEEGLSLDVHTTEHRCPCLQQGSLAAAKASVYGSLDQLVRIPGNEAIAYRMPCCDSLSTVSPRFYTEIFHHLSPQGNFLRLDSSVFQVFTSDDSELPRSLVRDGEGEERFLPYLAEDRQMGNYVVNFPYPYIIDRLGWQIPCLMPSDWCGQHENGENDSPKTVEDWKAGLDALVLKQGTLSICFHPHGWISNTSMIELIDHAEKKHEGKIMFLTFPEVEARLTRYLTAGVPLRADDGTDHGVRLADLNDDGWIDVMVGNPRKRVTRIWDPSESCWKESSLPVTFVEKGPGGSLCDAGVRFGVLTEDGAASLLVHTTTQSGIWHFDPRQNRWRRSSWEAAPREANEPIWTAVSGKDRGVRLLDFDGDGIGELVIGNPKQNFLFDWSRRGWKKCDAALPEHTMIVDQQGRDAGLRFWDVDDDGHRDVVFSNAVRYSVHGYDPERGDWSRPLVDQVRDRSQKDRKEIPRFVRADGSNNGAWLKHRHLWVQNEDNDGAVENAVEKLPMSILSGKE